MFRSIEITPRVSSVCSLPACGQGNRICVNKTGISLLLDSVRSVNDSYLFTHMRLPCPEGGGWHRRPSAAVLGAKNADAKRRLCERSEAGRVGGLADRPA